MARAVCAMRGQNYEPIMTENQMDKQLAALEQAPANGHALIHIGKTGGTSLRKLIQDLRQGGAALPIVKLGHVITLPLLREKRPDLRVGFVYRDPAARFVSGFYSRLRSGRPSYERPWTASEAAAYGFFPTATSLAEALYSDDDRLRSAAEFAMVAIPHLARGYVFYFKSPAYLRKAADSIYCLCDLDALQERVGEFFSPFGIPSASTTAQLQQYHKASQAAAPMSDLARQNLRQFWQAEYDIYAALCQLDAKRRAC
jgi:hypothetical protein